MIEAIICAINPDPDKLSKKRYKVAMRRKDVSLLSFGLLDGFYYISEDGTRSLASERYERYLQKNMLDFVAIMHLGSSPPHHYNIDDYGRKAYNLLFKDDGRCREILAEYLSKEKNYQKCFEEGIKNHIKEIKHEDGSIERRIDLPKPCYTLKNFSLIIDEPEPPEPEPPEPEPPEPEPPEPKDKSLLFKVLIAIIIILLLIAIKLLSLLLQVNDAIPDDSSYRQPASSSDYQNYELYLKSRTTTTERYIEGDTFYEKTTIVEEFSDSTANGTMPKLSIDEEAQDSSLLSKIENFFRRLKNLFREEEQFNE